MLSDSAIERATRLILDAVGVILADDPDLVAAPTKGVLVYEYMKEDGSISSNVFATVGVWSAETLGYLMVGQAMILDAMNSDD